MTAAGRAEASTTMTGVSWAAHPTPHQVKVARWLPSRRVLLGSYGQQKNTIEMWQLQQTVESAPKPIWSASVNSDVLDLAASLAPGGPIVAALASGDVLLGRAADHDLLTLHTAKTHQGPANALCISERRFDDGIGSVGEDGVLSVFAPEPGVAVFHERVSAGALRAVAFLTPSTLVTGGVSKQLALWDIRQKAQFLSPLTSALSNSEITALCALPEMSSVVAGGLDGVLSAWDIRFSGGAVATFDCANAFGKHSAASAIWGLSPLPIRSGMVLSCGQDGRLVAVDTRVDSMTIDDENDAVLEMAMPLNSVEVRPDSVNDVVVATDGCALLQIRLP